MKIWLEQWKSTEGRTETHWFDNESDEYLFGYNPKIVPKKLLNPIFRYLRALDKQGKKRNSKRKR